MSMVVTASAIAKYRETLKKISDKAAAEVQQYMLDRKFIIDRTFMDFAYAIATKYGEAAGALSCEFYDSMIDYWAAINRGEEPYRTGTPRPATPAETASLEEVYIAVNGAKKDSLSEVPQAVGRLVKLAAEDTTVDNAIRDGYEFAWVPSGDTCAYCIWLASLGWQKASKKALKDGHAEHVHANCDCTYIIRPSGDISVSRYDPSRYEEMYDSAEGDTQEEKLNSMRRQFYAQNKEKINAQKRSAYAKRKERESSEAEETDIE